AGRERPPCAAAPPARGPPPGQPGLGPAPALAERPRLARVLLRLRRELSSSRLGAPPLVLERLQPLLEARHRELCGRIDAQAFGARADRRLPLCQVLGSFERPRKLWEARHGGLCGRQPRERAAGGFLRGASVDLGIDLEQRVERFGVLAPRDLGAARLAIEPRPFGVEATELGTLGFERERGGVRLEVGLAEQLTDLLELGPGRPEGVRAAVDLLEAALQVRQALRRPGVVGGGQVPSFPAAPPFFGAAPLFAGRRAGRSLGELELGP